MEATLQVDIVEVQVVRHMDTLAPADVDTTALAAAITTAEASGVRSCATPAAAQRPRATYLLVKSSAVRSSTPPFLLSTLLFSVALLGPQVSSQQSKNPAGPSEGSAGGGAPPQGGLAFPLPTLSSLARPSTSTSTILLYRSSSWIIWNCLGTV